MNHKNLEVWKKSMLLVEEIYKMTNQFPEEEKFGLTNQIKRAAISVPSNIAEGSGRNSTKEFKRYLEIALGSLFELQTQIILSNYKEYLTKNKLETMEEQTEELQKMISSFMRSL